MEEAVGAWSEEAVERPDTWLGDLYASDVCRRVKNAATCDCEGGSCGTGTADTTDIRGHSEGARRDARVGSAAALANARAGIVVCSG